MITNTVHILTSSEKMLLHPLYADNKQTDVNYTEYIQNETLRLTFDRMGITSCKEPNLLSHLKSGYSFAAFFLYTIHKAGIY